jgi:hypothetical protein
MGCVSSVGQIESPTPRFMAQLNDPQSIAKALTSLQFLNHSILHDMAHFDADSFKILMDD